MPLPDSLHGNEYWEGLAAMRDEALVRSNMYGRRRHLGRLAFGRAMAGWQAATGGRTYLEEEGLKIGDTTLFNFHPTTMYVIDGHGSVVETTTFRIDTDSTGDIEVFRQMMGLVTLSEVIRSRIGGHAERRHQLHLPTDDDLAQVYTEMERGASGQYKLEA